MYSDIEKKNDFHVLPTRPWSCHPRVRMMFRVLLVPCVKLPQPAAIGLHAFLSQKGGGYIHFFVLCPFKNRPWQTIPPLKIPQEGQTKCFRLMKKLWFVKYLQRFVPNPDFLPVLAFVFSAWPLYHLKLVCRGVQNDFEFLFHPLNAGVTIYRG